MTEIDGMPVITATSLARGGLAEALESVRGRGQAVTITRNGKPVAILAPIPERPLHPTDLLASKTLGKTQ
jgi:prevent-host-death family protein